MGRGAQSVSVCFREAQITTENLDISNHSLIKEAESQIEQSTSCLFCHRTLPNMMSGAGQKSLSTINLDHKCHTFVCAFSVFIPSSLLLTIKEFPSLFYWIRHNLRFSFCRFEICEFPCIFQKLSHKSLLHLWNKFETFCTRTQTRTLQILHVCSRNEDAAVCGETHDMLCAWKTTKFRWFTCVACITCTEQFISRSGLQRLQPLMRFQQWLWQRWEGAYITEYVLQGWLVSTNVSLSLKGWA